MAVTRNPWAFDVYVGLSGLPSVVTVDASDFPGGFVASDSFWTVEASSDIVVAATLTHCSS